LAMLSEAVLKEFQKRLVGLKQPVKLVVFTQEMECQFCQSTRELAEDLTRVSEKLSTEVYDFVADKEKVEQYGIDKIPAIVVEGEVDYGIRFFGVPSGYEFGSLLEAANVVSRRNAMLAPETLEILKPLDRNVHIQVFVTPTCPYCPIAVKTAHRFAFAKEQVRADMVESTEFPHLANKYGVVSVPKIIVNDTFSIEGALPEREFALKMMEAVRSR
jgi:glutaredoxin-like protein